MRIFIDASNIRAGGGVTHLVELLRAASPLSFGFTEVILYAPRHTLNKIDDRDWLIKKHLPVLEKSFLHRALWQKTNLTKLVLESSADVLFVPGGSFSSKFHPVVTISQNLLPFMLKELLRYGISLFTIKLLLLRKIQAESFHRAAGVIFLTEFAKSAVSKVSNGFLGDVAIIPHGIDTRFMNPPKKQADISYFSESRPFRLLYVSIVDAYKHQWVVARAIRALRTEGLPITIDFIGPNNPRFLRKLTREISPQDDQKTIRYIGHIPFNDLHTYYQNADSFVFASSCENMPNILIEAMAAGLPIACSDRGPMPEVLEGHGIYFDPESAKSIEKAIKELFFSAELRTSLSSASQKKASQYSWKTCADNTFGFLEKIATCHKQKYPRSTM